MLRLICILLFTVLLGLMNTLALAKAPPASPQADLLQDKAVEAFIQDTAKTYRLPVLAVAQVMSHARTNPAVIDIMNRPYEAKPWAVYRAHFLTPQRIQSGVDFWNAHLNALKRAEKTYGVPASIIVAILGVETNYGQQLGQFSTLNTLSTLAFDYPKRQRFFKQELAAFIDLTYKNQLDPSKITGSYAGALGQTQFMPSSYLHYAVDFSGNRQIDLFHNTDDAIGSVANYLHQNGWQRGQPVEAPVHWRNGRPVTSLVNDSRKTPYTMGVLAHDGIITKQHYPSNLPANVLSLDGQNSEHAWVGFHNFYVITSYNTSLLYAMAVYQLSERICLLRAKQVST